VTLIPSQREDIPTEFARSLKRPINDIADVPIEDEANSKRTGSWALLLGACVAFSLVTRFAAIKHRGRRLSPMHTELRPPEAGSAPDDGVF